MVIQDMKVAVAQWALARVAAQRGLPVPVVQVRVAEPAAVAQRAQTEALLALEAVPPALQVVGWVAPLELTVEQPELLAGIVQAHAQGVEY